MHGVDWPAMQKKYAQFLPDLAARQDLTRVIQWMCSELAVGHHRTVGGDTLAEVQDRAGGAARRGLQRSRPVQLPFRQGLRRAQLESRAACAADRARRRREGGRVSAVGGGRGRQARRTSTASSRTLRGKLIEITVEPLADGEGLAHRLGGPDRQRAAAAPLRLGRGQPAQGRRERREAGSPTCTSRHGR